ncbi:hypothetical protein EDC01DRAFT_714248 [Geopyxis carbonaria]|nr:hypothetical protein EDC01DRAFT_714248 [Geopyxis carbonaria]
MSTSDPPAVPDTPSADPLPTVPPSDPPPAPSDPPSAPLLHPLLLHAYTLSPPCANHPQDSLSRLAPITQPNYTFLRLDAGMIQSDVQPHTDMTDCAPAERNTRLSDVGAMPVRRRREREGVVVAWVLPRVYRSAVTQEPTPGPGGDADPTLGSTPTPGPTPAADPTPPPPPPPPQKPPTYPDAPPRWLVLRHLDLTTISPSTPATRAHFATREYEAWVVESDHIWNLDTIPPHLDLQTDISPFISPVGAASSGGGSSISEDELNKQAEIFIGRRTDALSWDGEAPGDPENPRPAVNLLRAGNQLFADYQPHHANVFSIVDNFAYDGGFLDAAVASYCVVGWHAAAAADPLWRTGPRERRLENAFMHLASGGGWLKDTAEARTVCHGALYDVVWNADSKPASVPADTFAARLRDPEYPALSVGTTPMDAIVSYISARKTDGKEVSELEERVLRIQGLLHARDDGVETGREAMDTVHNWNFSRSQGGKQWVLAAAGSGGDEERELSARVRALNAVQMHLDAVDRAAVQYRWDMFALWWKKAGGVAFAGGEAENVVQYTRRAAAVEEKVTQCVAKHEELQRAIDATLEGPAGAGRLKDVVTAAAQAPFHRALDPTVLIGGIESGWPVDFLEPAKVRLPSQTVPGDKPIDGALTALIKHLSAPSATLPDVPKAPTEVTGVLGRLFAEFAALKPKSDGEAEVVIPGGAVPPQFHDQKTTDASWRDRWSNRQPWFPLFVEWEVEYTHIPFGRVDDPPDDNFWSLDEHTARASVNKMVRYGLKDHPLPLHKRLPMPHSSRDLRICSGRSLVLPQPSFSLAAKVEQLLDDTPPSVLDKYLKLDKAEKKALVAAVKTLPYLSAPLSGLTDNLVTLAQGTHIKPEFRSPRAGAADELVVTEAAVNTKFGLTRERLSLIQGQSALTPFAGSARFTNAEHCPFKPVTHGQVRFRKFNVVDKFGQVLVGVDAAADADAGTRLYPCISDYYEPQLQPGSRPGADARANTALDDAAGHCEFLQLPPQINQPSRLAAAFVVREEDAEASGAYWRPAADADNPVWGWIVVNYADYGLQLFTPAGGFYREIRIGGPLGTLASAAWLPFDPDPSEARAENAQLDAFIAQLHGDATYTTELWDMLTQALAALQPAPSAYAEYVNALVGRPLALVNTGWALELAGPEYVNQATSAARQTPDTYLLSGAGKRAYEFQLKLGDKARAYDGLVGYFTATPEKHRVPGAELDLTRVYSYFADAEATGHAKPAQVVPIATDNYPRLTAHWAPPAAASTRDITTARNDAMKVFGAIVDPFAPLHAYSSFQPVAALALPPWTWQRAMAAMTAFFHAGPLALTKDVPGFDDDRRVKQTVEKKKDGKGVEREKTEIALPGLASADWRWLQPYVPLDAEGCEVDDVDVKPVYNAHALSTVGNAQAPAFAQGPYTAVEGYLQLVKSMDEVHEGGKKPEPVVAS